MITTCSGTAFSHFVYTLVFSRQTRLQNVASLARKKLIPMCKQNSKKLFQNEWKIWAKKNNRPNHPESEKLYILRKATASEKLQRHCKRPLSYYRLVPRSGAQRVQCETANKTQNDPNTCCISQPEGLRRAPFNASDVAAAERSEMHRQQHGKVHHIFNRESAFH